MLGRRVVLPVVVQDRLCLQRVPDRFYSDFYTLSLPLFLSLSLSLSLSVRRFNMNRNLPLWAAKPAKFRDPYIIMWTGNIFMAAQAHQRSLFVHTSHKSPFLVSQLIHFNLKIETFSATSNSLIATIIIFLTRLWVNKRDSGNIRHT